MATITLTYECAVGVLAPASLVSQVSGVNLYNNGTLEILGMSVLPGDDTTAAVGDHVEREIILTVNPDGEARFPTDKDKKDATRNLFRAQLAAGSLTRVTALEPVVTP